MSKLQYCAACRRRRGRTWWQRLTLRRAKVCQCHPLACEPVDELAPPIAREPAATPAPPYVYDWDPATPFTIQRVDYKPGDTIVVRSPGALCKQAIENIRTVIEERFPACRCLVLEDGLELSVAGPAAVAEEQSADWVDFQGWSIGTKDLLVDLEDGGRYRVAGIDRGRLALMAVDQGKHRSMLIDRARLRKSFVMVERDGTRP